MKNSDYYVYVYTNPLKQGDYNYGEYHFDYEPFYVGKGRNARWRHHLLDALNKDIVPNEYHNPHKLKTIRKILRNNYNMEDFIINIKNNISEKDAIELEHKLIMCCGRKDNTTGILTNLTDGGFGMSGHIHTNEQRKVQSIRQIQKFIDNPEHAFKISEGMKRWVQNNPEQSEIYIEKRKHAVKTETARKKNSEATKKWVEENLQNPEAYFKKISALSHTPEAQKKRTESFKLWIKEHPQEWEDYEDMLDALFNGKLGEEYDKTRRQNSE